MYGTLQSSITPFQAKAGKTGYSLFEENRTETRVESTDTLMLQDLAESTGQTVGESGFRYETDTGSLKGAESDISDEFSASGGGQVDGGTVVGGSLVAESVDGLLLEELITTELEAPLQEVSGRGRAETSEKGTGTFIGDDLSETTDHTPVVGLGVELDSCLDTIRH